MVKEGTKEKAQKKRRSTTKTTTEEMLAFQMEQFNYQNRIKNMRLCFVIHLNDKEKSKQKNDKKIEIFSENLEKYLVEICNCFQLLNYSI